MLLPLNHPVKQLLAPAASAAAAAGAASNV
jgi:hypothetical protein